MLNTELFPQGYLSSSYKINAGSDAQGGLI